MKAEFSWDTSILLQLYTTEAMDAALFQWDCICMDSSDPMWSPRPFRDIVPPGKGMVCGIWVQIASSLSALVLELPSDYDPSGLMTCLSDQISCTELLDFSTSTHVHTQCSRASLPSHVMESGCNLTLAAMAMAFHLNMVVCICGDVCVIGLSDGDALVCHLAMTANLLADTGATICLGNNESLLVDVHDIDPNPVSVETTPKDAMQITYCCWMGFFPMHCEDGSNHMQPWYINPDAVGCMLLPEIIMSSSPDIISWYQEGFRDSLNLEILCFRNFNNVPVLKLTLQKCNGLYYEHTKVLSIDHNPIRVHCVNGALVLHASSWTGSCEKYPSRPNHTSSCITNPHQRL